MVDDTGFGDGVSHVRNSALGHLTGGSASLHWFPIALIIAWAFSGGNGIIYSKSPRADKLALLKWRFQATSAMRIAIAYLVLGNNEAAIETLEAACKLDGPVVQNRALDLWFIFDRLRGNPRFDKLLED